MIIQNQLSEHQHTNKYRVCTLRSCQLCAALRRAVIFGESVVNVQIKSDTKSDCVCRLANSQIVLSSDESITYLCPVKSQPSLTWLLQLNSQFLAQLQKVAPSI